MPEIIAHRGYSKKAPENTLSSIRMAIEQGVDYVEIDVHMSKDGIPIVIHDSFLERTTNAKDMLRVTDMTYAQIKTFDAGSWFDFYFQGETIPTLKEVLALNFNSSGLMIEIKKGHSQVKPLTTAVGKLVREAIAKTNFNKILVGSFSYHILSELRVQFPALELVGIVEDFNSLQPMMSLKLPYLAIWHKLATPTLLKTLHENNTKVWAFTVDSIETAQALDQMNIDGLITNDPDAMITVNQK